MMFKYIKIKHKKFDHQGWWVYLIENHEDLTKFADAISLDEFNEFGFIYMHDRRKLINQGKKLIINADMFGYTVLDDQYEILEELESKKFKYVLEG